MRGRQGVDSACLMNCEQALAILLHKCLRELNFSTFPSKTKETGREKRERKRIQKEKREPRTVTNRSGETVDERGKDKVLESHAHPEEALVEEGPEAPPLGHQRTAQQDRCHSVATACDALAGLQEKAPSPRFQLVLDTVPGP